MNEIDWREVEIGQEYLFEEKYYFQAKVKLVNRYFSETYPEFLIVDVEVIEPFTGCEKGKTYSFGKNVTEKYSYLTQDMKFLSLNSKFTYITELPQF